LTIDDCRRRALTAAAGCALLLTASGRAERPAPVPAPGFTGLAGLKVAYDAILDARFADADRAIDAACPPAPSEACEVLSATSLWWQILLDPRDRSRDAEFEARVDEAIARSEAWAAREPERAEAWFYVGGAYGARVSWRVERGQRLSAARDGKQIKESLEQALEIDPAFEDARFGIGLYKYYADVAPTAAKLLRFLLLLPGGDKVAGLADMQATESRGELIAGEALYQLHWIYFWYEEQPARGLDALERLHGRYPGNPHFLQRIGEVEVEYFHDAARSLAAWRRLAETASRSDVPDLAETRGRLGMAEQLDALDETDLALPELRRVIAQGSRRPAGAQARAHLLLGRALDRVGDRQGALAAYRAAQKLPVPAGDPDHVGAGARAGLSKAPAPRAAEGYRLSLEGWRRFQHGDAAGAAASLARAYQLAPDEALVRARLARVRARTAPEQSLAEFEALIAMRPRVSPLALGAAYFWSAEILDAEGRREEAVDRYRAAARVHAGDSRVADAAKAALSTKK
jgi:tetratricopeptide (TPR) repeat protein